MVCPCQRCVPLLAALSKAHNVSGTAPLTCILVDKTKSAAEEPRREFLGGIVRSNNARLNRLVDDDRRVFSH